MYEATDTTAPSAWLSLAAAFQAGGIYYAAVPCKLGFMILAASRQGLCYCAFADTLDRLQEALHAQFTRHRVLAGDDGLHTLARSLAACLGKPTRPDGLLLALQGTPFQCRVWHAIREIRYGETVSYAEIARRISTPKAARAVAAACAANPVSVLVPCHRVIRSDGCLSGYRWGTWRKQALLTWEQAGTDD